jgi:hypothetical protein
MNKLYLFNYLFTHQWLIALLILWTLPWKGVALWKAARNKSIAWFVLIFVINTLGLLEIIYIFFFSKEKPLVTGSIEDKNIPEKKIV